MNPLLFLFILIAGICAVISGIAGLVTSTTPGSDTKAQHGDRRIVHDPSMDWYTVESYYAYPGWYKIERHDNLESAKTSKAKWDKIHNAKEPTVIKP